MSESVYQRLINVVVETLPDLESTLVTLMYPAKFRTSCLFDIVDFPFDKQTCRMIFASWTHDIKTLDYYSAHGDSVPLIYFIKNQEWEILKFNVTRVEVSYECCPNPYVNLEYTLVIQRKPVMLNLAFSSCKAKPFLTMEGKVKPKNYFCYGLKQIFHKAECFC